VRYSGKNAFVCTSNAYAHSTLESAGVECVGGERRRRLDTTLNKQTDEQALYHEANILTIAQWPPGHQKEESPAISSTEQCSTSPTDRKSRQHPMRWRILKEF